MSSRREFSFDPETEARGSFEDTIFCAVKCLFSEAEEGETRLRTSGSCSSAGRALGFETRETCHAARVKITDSKQAREYFYTPMRPQSEGRRREPQQQKKTKRRSYCCFKYFSRTLTAQIGLATLCSEVPCYAPSQFFCKTHRISVKSTSQLSLQSTPAYGMGEHC